MDPRPERDSGGGDIWKRLLNGLAVVAVLVAGWLFVLYFAPLTGLALGAVALLIGIPVLGWLLLIWISKKAGQAFGANAAEARAIGACVFVVVVVGGLLTSCALQFALVTRVQNSLESAITGSSGDNDAPQPAQDTSKMISSSARRCTVSFAQYQRLSDDMSYTTAHQILGCDGKEMSRMDLGGVQTVMYMWWGTGLGNMNVMFQNDRLVSKAQFGLK